MLKGLPVLGEAGDDFSRARPPFNAHSGVAAGTWQVDVPSRHMPPELQVSPINWRDTRFECCIAAQCHHLIVIIAPELEQWHITKVQLALARWRKSPTSEGVATHYGRPLSRVTPELGNAF